MSAPSPIDARAALRRRGRLARLGVYVALAAWFVLIAFYVGPSWILFHKLTWITPADFVDVAARDVRPIVVAIKQCRADTGQLPGDHARLDEALRPYAPSMAETLRSRAHMWDGRLNYRTFNHDNTIRYDFAAGREGWSVGGALMRRGPIPLPPVAFDPAATRATTRPN